MSRAALAAAFLCAPLLPAPRAAALLAPGAGDPPAAAALEALEPGRPHKWRSNKRARHGHSSDWFHQLDLQQQSATAKLLNMSVAVFVQLGNTAAWQDMKTCVQSVAQVPFKAVDVYVSLVQPNTSVEQDVRGLNSSIAGVRAGRAAVVQNRGADQGQFLQQLQGVDPGTYDLVLKVHSKSNLCWRYLALDTLCGTQHQVEQVANEFIRDDKMALVGPDLLTVSANFKRLTQIFSEGEQAAMHQVWQYLAPKEPFPPQSAWTIVAGSMFWAKGGFIDGTPLRAAGPQLLESMAPGYATGSCCQTAHGLERMLPTRAVVQGLKVGTVTSTGDGEFAKRIKRPAPFLSRDADSEDSASDGTLQELDVHCG